MYIAFLTGIERTFAEVLSASAPLTSSSPPQPEHPDADPSLQLCFHMQPEYPSENALFLILERGLVRLKVNVNHVKHVLIDHLSGRIDIETDGVLSIEIRSGDDDRYVAVQDPYIMVDKFDDAQQWTCWRDQSDELPLPRLGRTLLRNWRTSSPCLVNYVESDPDVISVLTIVLYTR